MRSAYLALALAACSPAPRVAVPSSASPIEVRCENDPVVVHFDRRCASDADCALGSVTIDCCGTEQVVGIAAEERARWNEQVSLCGPNAGSCECVAEMSVADDGTRGERAAAVCREGSCTTTFAER
jgi:hypothetical protein